MNHYPPAPVKRQPKFKTLGIVVAAVVLGAVLAIGAVVLRNSQNSVSDCASTITSMLDSNYQTTDTMLTSALPDQIQGCHGLTLQQFGRAQGMAYGRYMSGG